MHVRGEQAICSFDRGYCIFQNRKHGGYECRVIESVLISLTMLHYHACWCWWPDATCRVSLPGVMLVPGHGSNRAMRDDGSTNRGSGPINEMNPAT